MVICAGIKEYSILFRKAQRDNSYQYTVKDDTDRSLTVTLEGTCSGDDPLKGLHFCEMKVTTDQVIALVIDSECYIKRV